MKKLTTREIYFKTLIESEIPVAELCYNYKDNEGIIQFRHVRIELRNYEPVITDSINKLKKVEETPGFMFFGNTVECDEFWKDIKFELKLNYNYD